MRPEVHGISVWLDPEDVRTTIDIENLVWRTWQMDILPENLRSRKVNFNELMQEEGVVVSEKIATRIGSLAVIAGGIHFDHYQRSSLKHEEISEKEDMTLESTSTDLQKLEEEMHSAVLKQRQARQFAEQIRGALDQSRQLNANTDQHQATA